MGASPRGQSTRIVVREEGKKKRTGEGPCSWPWLLMVMGMGSEG